MKSINLVTKFVRIILAILLPSLVIVSLYYTSISAYASPEKISNELVVKTAATTVTIRSVGEYDGSTVECSENSETGCSSHNHYDAVRVGDDDEDRQYRAILSFRTAPLPNTVTITAVKLKLKYAGKFGTLPFKTHNGLYVDVKTPAFAGWPGEGYPALSLLPGDFEAPATKLLAAKISATPINGWYTANIPVQYISKTGTTQFRLRFLKGDNDDLSEDYIEFFEGDYAGIASRPRLIITYTQ